MCHLCVLGIDFEIKIEFIIKKKMINKRCQVFPKFWKIIG